MTIVSQVILKPQLKQTQSQAYQPMGALQRESIARARCLICGCNTLFNMNTNRVYSLTLATINHTLICIGFLEPCLQQNRLATGTFLLKHAMYLLEGIVCCEHLSIRCVFTYVRKHQIETECNDMQK